jgi:hypothetical protein
MGKAMNKEKSRKFSIETLIDALGASEDQTVEEVKQELGGEGLKVDAAIKTLLDTVRECSMASRRMELDLAKKEREAKRLTGTSQLGKFRSWTREQIINRMIEIANTSGGKLSLNYRDLEDRGIEDMRSLLEDMEIAFHRENTKEDTNGS